MLSVNPHTAAEKNLYAYCANNPIVYEDSSGQALDMVFDIVSCVLSVAEFIDEPSLLGFLGVMGDIADIALPMVGGIGETVRSLKTADKIADSVSDANKVQKSLHRPYIRKHVRLEVESRAMKTADGRFIDPNTLKPINGKYDLGHKYGHEFWREKEKAEKAGMTQREFNDYMNNPDFYQIEDHSSNRSHRYEKHR